jgi:hypothetical protein
MRDAQVPSAGISVAMNVRFARLTLVYISCQRITFSGLTWRIFGNKRALGAHFTSASSYEI